jgi:hypothetical protein
MDWLEENLDDLLLSPANGRPTRLPIRKTEPNGASLSPGTGSGNSPCASTSPGTSLASSIDGQTPRPSDGTYADVEEEVVESNKVVDATEAGIKVATWSRGHSEFGKYLTPKFLVGMEGKDVSNLILDTSQNSGCRYPTRSYLFGLNSDYRLIQISEKTFNIL